MKLKRKDFEVDLERKHCCDGVHFGNAFVKIKLPNTNEDWRIQGKKLVNQILKNQRAAEKHK